MVARAFFFRKVLKVGPLLSGDVNSFAWFKWDGRLLRRNCKRNREIEGNKMNRKLLPKKKNLQVGRAQFLFEKIIG